MASCPDCDLLRPFPDEDSRERWADKHWEQTDHLPQFFTTDDSLIFSPEADA
jgi:hypothetical protein